jgi:hypothetical protein
MLPIYALIALALALATLHTASSTLARAKEDASQRKSRDAVVSPLSFTEPRVALSGVARGGW